MGLIRIFLAFIVLISHIPNGPILRPLHPALAVQCFYVISGFYIQLILIERYSAATWGDVKNFYKSRMARIFPIYYCVTIPTLILLGSDWFIQHWNDHDVAGILLFFFTNLFLLGQDLVGYYVPYHGMDINLASWSVSIELMFYLIAPWLLQRSTRKLVLAAIVLATLRVLCAGTEYMHPEQFHALFPKTLWAFNWLYNFFPAEFSLFIAGAISCRFYHRWLVPLRAKARSLSMPLWTEFAFQVLCGGIWGFYFWFVWRGWQHVPGGAWDSGMFNVPMRYWAVIVVTIACIPFIFHFTRNFRADRMLGELSYPLYICHYTFILIFQKWPLVAQEHQQVAVVIAASITSLLLWLLVEIPVDRWRHRKFRGDKLHTQAGAEKASNGEVGITDLSSFAANPVA